MAFPKSLGKTILGLSFFLAVASLLLARGQTVIFSSYLGVADCDGIAVGPTGDLYLACHSPSSQLPIEPQPSRPPPAKRGDAALDAYVIRLDPRKDQLIYATRLGGSDYDESSRIRVDPRGFAWVVGLTKSRDFPTTADAIQRSYGGGESDGFLTELDPKGHVVYSTFLGGDGIDEIDPLEVDDSGAVFVGGITGSDNFPGQGTPGSSRKHGAFIARIDPRRGTLRSVVLGGQQGQVLKDLDSAEIEEMLTGLAFDGRGGIFATGWTKSKDFLTLQPLQSELRGKSDAFLTRLAADTLAPTFSTYFGRSGDTAAWGVTTDHGDPIIVGTTDASDLPTSANSFQPRNRGGKDVFVARFAGPGYRTVQSTYLGGTRDDGAGGDGDDVKVTADGTIWLLGWTSSPDFPAQNPMQARYGGGESDGFIAALSPDLGHLCYSTYRGGSDQDTLEGLAFAKSGSVVFATGVTFSRDVPMAAKTIQKELTGVTLAGKSVNAMLLGLLVGEPCRVGSVTAR